MLKEQDTMIKQQNLPLLLICVGWLVETLGAAPALVVYQPPRIEAEVGHPVVLSCTVNNTGGQFFSGVFYRGNSELEVDGSVWCLSRDSCNLSLTIESPSLADANVYYCEVNMPSVEEARTVKGSGTQLSLYVQPASIEIQQSSPLVSGRTATLDCKVSGFYPRNASVLWFHRGTPVSPGSVTENITMNNDGTFSLLSQYNFSPTVKDNNAECACQASHPMWTQTNRTSITLNGSYGNKPVCGLALIPFAWVSVIVIIILQKKRKRKNQDQVTLVYAGHRSQEETHPTAGQQSSEAIE
ncbi:vascular cell adhesion protein 1-like isoform X1 [Anguilla rostrata]|uniref:vascular cell adhesion protein 1-like isoform X1 n=1 Tax=Anguilla rostrata TaxID=7938 RepID=UPI0030D3C499